MDKKLASIIRYFAVFEYFPSFKEVYTFFPEKISKKRLKILYEAKKYTVGEYSKKISKKKLQNWRFRTYIKFISLFPQIKLVGLSGSIAMMNARIDDDIDLFIITKKDHLFTARFLATIIAFIMGLKRPLGLKKASDKVCLNLFFEESNLKVPKFKQTLFVGHEVLQMKPIINKDYTYERFLQANQWVFRLFPNAPFPVISSEATEKSLPAGRQVAKRNKLGDWLENFLKQLQLYLIRKHQTTEIITDTQLWFHPVDFGKKLKL